MKNPPKLKRLFDEKVAENTQMGIGHFPDGRSFVGRIIRNDDKYMTLIGFKNKRLKVYSFAKLAG